MIESKDKQIKQNEFYVDACILHFIKLGYPVCKPIIPKSCLYDFILDLGKALLRVKCVEPEKLPDVAIKDKLYNGHNYDSLDDIDYLVIMDKDECYFIPYNVEEES